jgi:hypothetical protein
MTYREALSGELETRVRDICAEHVTDEGELEQIPFLLGHVSIQTTERYLGCKQRIRAKVKTGLASNPRAESSGTTSG